MTDKYVVACDGSPASERALQLAVAQAKTNGASILVAHVLEWSPYSFLTPEEIEERHKRRNEELKRAEQALVEPLLASANSAGITVDSLIKYGHVAETLADIASKQGATQLFVGRTGHSRLAARIFGSVAGAMAQSSPVPCTIVP
jgi:nucleotide-binding universal stress UspA family protein